MIFLKSDKAGLCQPSGGVQESYTVWMWTKNSLNSDIKEEETTLLTPSF